MDNRIKMLRENAGMTQSKLAGLVGVKQNYISGYESGKVDPPWDILRRLVDIFGTTLDYLLCVTDAPPDKTQEEMLKNLHFQSAQLGQEEQEILKRLNALNMDGVERLIEYADLLHQSERYRKKPGTASPGE